MLVRVLGNVTLAKFVQDANAWVPILVTPLDIVTLVIVEFPCNPPQPTKYDAPPRMLVTL
jgi:hypothetical protein